MMKMHGLYLIAMVGLGSSAFAQPVIPAEFEINGAADIRAVFDPTFTDQQFDGAKGLATDGDTFVIGRTNKIDYNTAQPGNDPLVPGELLIYRKNTSGVGPEFNLVARLNDSVVGMAGVSLVEPDDQFGWTVAIQGNTMVVGSPYYPHVDDVTSATPGFVQDTLVGYGDEDETGAVFVYKRPNSSSNAWTLEQVLYDSQPVNGERFGINVLFHDSRLLVCASRNFRPGYSEARPIGPGGFTGSGHCDNISSSVEVYEVSPFTGDYGHVQTIDLPFLMGESNYGVAPNGDPVDSVGDCSPFPAVGFDGVPPIDSRNGEGFDEERARDIAVDGEWLVTVGMPGLFVYEYDYIAGQYDFFQGIRPNGIDTGDKGFTAVDIDDDVIAVGIKNHMDPVEPGTGGVAMYEYNPSLMEWERTLVKHTGGGNGINLFEDTVIVTSNTLWRYLRSSDELLLIGSVPGAGGTPHSKAIWNGDLFYLSDHISRLLIPTQGPSIVRAISDCPYDLNGDGTLNYFDISAYMTLYGAGDPQADYAAPYGTLDMDDVDHYMALYNSGCP